MVLARAESGSIKRLRVGAEAAEANLRALLKDVYAQAGVNGVDAASCGVASCSVPGTVEWITAVLKEFGAAQIEVVGDEVIALDAAFRGGPGILQIAGTGSNTIGRAPDGSRECAGGYSSHLGDEGSGYWIGLEAIRAALRAQDRIGLGGVSTCLLREIERHWGLGSTSELITLGNQRSPSPDFAELAPVVARCAEAGDVLAAGIRERAGEELAEVVGLVFHKMGAPAEVGVAFTGSVLGRIDAVRVAMVARLAISVPGARVAEAAVDSLDGALWRARRGVRFEGG
jgi:N-acetylglucosamine kinase-like BadF-type ATPase